MTDLAPEHHAQHNRSRCLTNVEKTGDDGKRKYTLQQIAEEFGVTRPTIYRNLSKTTSSS